MTRDAAVAQIAARLGQRAGLSAQILIELDSAQFTFEHEPKLPWFLEKIGDYNISPTVATNTVPADYLRELDDQSLVWLPDAANAGYHYPIDRSDPIDVEGDSALRVPGTPTFYYVFAGLIYALPRPSAIIAAKLHYYAKDVIPSAIVLGGTGTNLWLTNAPDLLIAEAGYWLGTFLRDQGAAAVFGLERDRARRRLVEEMAARETAGQTTTMPG